MLMNPRAMRGNNLTLRFPARYVARPAVFNPHQGQHSQTRPRALRLSRSISPLTVIQKRYAPLLSVTRNGKTV